MSNHIGQRFIASIENLVQTEVKSKTRGIHHYYSKMISVLINDYESHIEYLYDHILSLREPNKKNDKLIIFESPFVDLPRGLKFPDRVFLDEKIRNLGKIVNPEAIPLPSVETKQVVEKTPFNESKPV